MLRNGKIWSKRLKRFIGVLNYKGYYQVPSPKGYKNQHLHQYIWMVGNNAEIPDGYDIHHVDGNKENNSIYNLELIKHSQHTIEHKQGNKYRLGKKHSKETIKKISKQVGQYTSNGKLVKIWDSINDCRRNGYDNVSDCCLGKRKTSEGYIWKYIENEKDVD